MYDQMNIPKLDHKGMYRLLFFAYFSHYLANSKYEPAPEVMKTPSLNV